MGSSITGKEYPLLKIFSSDFEYHIPSYQRPYAWTEAEAGELFDDLLDFYKTQQDDSYFLGSIVLIKEENDPFSQVIDGQQRLTTLSILFAAMADRFTVPARKVACKKYLEEEGDELAGIPGQPRLFLRSRDQPFFNKYIQSVDLDALLQLDPAKLDDEAQVHIQQNCGVLRDRFADSFATDEELVGFSRFLLNRCFLIAVTTSSQESAFRIFSVMNSRGLDLLPTDIIKSETIGKLPLSQQEAYTSKWEEMETDAGREGFNDVLGHTRTIFVKERPRRNLLDEFREYVSDRMSPQTLVDRYLDPYTQAYVQLKGCSYTATKHAGEINSLLRWLNKTGNSDWMSAAIKFVSERPNDSAYTLWFMRKLERLASYLLVTARDVNQRVSRYKWLLVEMEGCPDSSLDHPLVNIELTEWEKQQFRQALDGEIYTMPAQRRNYIIQRLDSFVSDGGATYDSGLFTIEHVLPQHPAPGSEWLELWPDEQERGRWLNRIANLVPLTRQRNSAAQNYDFKTKKSKYFTSKDGTSSYTLTTQVLGVDAWTPAVVEARQHDLLQKFCARWELGEDPGAEDNPDFMIAGRGGDATGHPLDDGRFVVHAGSRTSADVTEGLQGGYAELRNKLVAGGAIEDRRFLQDVTFDSPSAAAAVVLGRSANGRREWTKLDGRSLMQTGH